jgi:hypothetical protein
LKIPTRLKYTQITIIYAFFNKHHTVSSTSFFEVEKNEGLFCFVRLPRTKSAFLRTRLCLKSLLRTLLNTNKPDVGSALRRRHPRARCSPTPTLAVRGSCQNFESKKYTVSNYTRPNNKD